MEVAGRRTDAATLGWVFLRCVTIWRSRWRAHVDGATTFDCPSIARLCQFEQGPSRCKPEDVAGRTVWANRWQGGVCGALPGDCEGSPYWITIKVYAPALLSTLGSGRFLQHPSVSGCLVKEKVYESKYDSHRAGPAGPSAGRAGSAHVVVAVGSHAGRHTGPGGSCSAPARRVWAGQPGRRR